MIYSALNCALYMHKLIYSLRPFFVEGIFTIPALKVRKLSFREERQGAYS